MNKITQKVQKQVTQTAKQAAQAAVQQAKTQTFESLKSAQKQVSPLPERGQERPVQAQPSIVDTVQQQGPQALNAEEIHRREQALMGQLRARLNQEIQAAQQARLQQQQGWYQEQSQLMQPPQAQEARASIPLPTGPQRGPGRGAKGKIQQKQARRETGRGAKN